MEAKLHLYQAHATTSLITQTAVLVECYDYNYVCTEGKQHNKKNKVKSIVEDSI